MEFFVVIYDIFSKDPQRGAWFSCDYYRRGRVARELLRFGVRVQRSVYEVYLNKKEKRRFVENLRKLTIEGDKVFIYLIEKKVRDRKKVVGTPLFPKDLLII